VIVDDFDFVGIFVLPAETNAELIVDSDAVTTGSIAAQGLQMVSRRNSQFAEPPDAIDLVELSARYWP
jgi:hypothetical protein